MSTSAGANSWKLGNSTAITSPVARATSDADRAWYQRAQDRYFEELARCGRSPSMLGARLVAYGNFARADYYWGYRNPTFNALYERMQNAADPARKQAAEKQLADAKAVIEKRARAQFK